MAAHEHELSQLMDRLDADRQRQQLALRERIARQRKQKVEALQRRQEAELAKEMVLQEKELEELRTKQV